MWKKYKKPILAGVVILAVLAAAFFLGGSPEKGTTQGNAGNPQNEVQDPSLSGNELPSDDPSDPVTPDTPDPSGEETPETPDAPETPETPGTPEPPAVSYSGGHPGAGQEAQDPYHTDPVPAGKPQPVEPQDQETGGSITVTVSISCATILDNMDLCDADKKELVPEDGWILKPVSVEAQEGESAFSLLQRVCKDKKIHMEFSMTPIYNSAYIEGIGNLYEFDVGKESGWMFRVNDWFPNYGCSRYVLKDGDTVEWVYTCDLGKDVGGGQAVQSES